VIGSRGRDHQVRNYRLITVVKKNLILNCVPSVCRICVPSKIASELLCTHLDLDCCELMPSAIYRMIPYSEADKNQLKD
jgi:hypothetical protein